MLDRLTIERMAAKAGESPILIALSGGGDSVALLHLLAQEFGAERLQAVVVDHALRQASRADAERAAAVASSAGVSCEIVSLTWPERSNRAHEAAREARYSALCNAAGVAGARVIATGHTRDDQAETVLLRGARGSGMFGLAGMRSLARVPLWPQGQGLWLARPLLSARRSALRTMLRDRDIAWLEDPANANEAYARVRARRTLAELEHAGLDPMRFAGLAERLAPVSEALDTAALQLINRSVEVDAGLIIIRRELWDGETATRHRALGALITAAGAQQRPPNAEQLAAFDITVSSSDFRSATLGGALARASRGDVTLTRDRGALAGRADGTQPIAALALPPHETVVWDNRIALTTAEAGWSVVFEDGRPQLARGEERAALAYASPYWLLKTRVRHVLGRD